MVDGTRNLSSYWWNVIILPTDDGCWKVGLIWYTQPIYNYYYYYFSNCGQ